MKNFDTIIIGAGAAGLICAWEAAKRGRSVAIIEHASKIGEKIRISGGGRCNFTNLYCSPANFLSQNPHFCKSALSRFTPQDFIALITEHKIAYHEKPFTAKTGNENARGQLFCDDSATQIIEMLKNGVINCGGTFLLDTKVDNITRAQEMFFLETKDTTLTCESLVIASGGLSIPKIGASNFGYEQAKKFGLNIIPPRPALVPLTFDEKLLARTSTLSGIAVDAIVSCAGKSFREGLLFTHRGLSGPAILQISSYWREGDKIAINLLPEHDITSILKQARSAHPKQHLSTILSHYMPARLAQIIAEITEFSGNIGNLSDAYISQISHIIHSWQILPEGSEGYRTAEVTLGGVDTREISSKTFESNKVKGLFFIGEVLDVTGHLGGHNFQWAWASGWCAGQYV